MSTAIWWIRRDQRLSDNQALNFALRHHSQVVPIFVFDPQLWDSPQTAEKRLGFIVDGLRSLDREIQKRGGYLILRRGEPVAVLTQLMRETGARMIYAEADFTPYARRRDAHVAREIPLTLLPGLTIYPPESILKSDGSPYTVFTPFRRAWVLQPWSEPPLQAPEHIPVPGEILSNVLPDEPSLPASVPFVAGEIEGQQRLTAFTSGPEAPIHRYHVERNRVDINSTSGLSPYLRFGMVSARQAVWEARQAEAHPGSGGGPATWLNELIWREFYIYILYHFPHVRQTAFRAELRHILWNNDRADFTAWQEGRTGYPIVDAAMRQLTQTGWMHNRARMITASFLTKDLLIDWRWGERHFMQHLIDGDVAANNGGWQWTAGTGTDAAPYFRIFNPIVQSRKFDPAGTYIRRFLPELENVPNEFIHEPWKMPLEMQRKVGCIIGRDYPFPIVDHSLARERALNAYRSGGG